MMNKLMIEKFQKASVEIEKEMLVFLLQYAPCLSMTVGDVKTIAGFARNTAYKAYDKALSTGD